MFAFTGVLEPVARIVVATLFNSLWEAALLAFAVWLILRALPNLNATTRYAAWCVALVASLLLPLATALPQISVQQSISHNAALPVKSLPILVPQKSSAKTAATVHTTAAAPAPHNALRLPQRLRFAVPQYVALGLFAAWVLAAIALLVRLGINLYRLERLKADALPLPVDYRERLSRWSSAEKGGRDVRLCTCDGIEVPVAVGLFDSMILIPQHLLETLSQEEMDQIMLHELAHLRRADDWTNGIQRFIQALFFFNPAVLYIAQQLDLEREVACDDWVVHQTQDVRPYATCLTKMAEVTAWPHRALAAPGVFITRRGLSVRVERLLRAGRNVRTSIAFGPAGGVVAVLVVLFFVLQTVAPTFAFTLPEEKAAAMVAASSATTAPSPAAKHQNARHEQQHITIIKHRDNAVNAGDTQTIDVPAQHVHIKGQTIHTPDVNIDIPARHIVVPKVASHYPVAPMQPDGVLPPDFAKNITAMTSKTIDAAMKSAFNASHMRNANCTGCDFSGQNLSGRSFRGQRMSGSDFSRANLQNADFSNTVMVGADFSRANLRGANFANAVLTGCDFSHADLTNVNFAGAQVTGCDVSARSLSASQAGTLLRACRSGCDFSGANLQNQDLHGVNLMGTDLSGADLRGANLSGGSFSGVDFAHARMDGAKVDGANFTGCDFSGVDIRSADFDRASFTGTKFSNPR